MLVAMVAYLCYITIYLIQLYYLTLTLYFSIIITKDTNFCKQKILKVVRVIKNYVNTTEKSLSWVLAKQKYEKKVTLLKLDHFFYNLPLLFNPNLRF